MLTVGQRLRRRTEFSAAVRSGRRVGRGVLVVHLSRMRAGGAEGAGARAGFVIPRSVGPAVARNKVRRRLRHLVRDRLALLPDGTDLVIRALPGSAGCSFERLGRDLDAAIAAAQTAKRNSRDGAHRSRTATRVTR